MKQILKNRKEQPVTSFIRRLLMLVIPAGLLWSCTEVKDWSDPADDTPPGTVTVVDVENFSGGAIIRYTRPDDNDLMAVKAVYSFDENDIRREVYASAFRDSIVLEGYADTGEHTVELYAIDESGNLSSSVPVTIHPGTPPIDVIRQSLKVTPTFGGLYTTWENPLGKSMDITLYRIDSVGERVLHDRYYSSAFNDSYSFRNLASEEQPFHIELRDRWNHYATPLDTIMEPMFETQIMGRDELNRNVWSLYSMENNTYLYMGEAKTLSDRPFSRVFDGNIPTTDNLNYFWAADPTLPSDYFPGGGNSYIWPVYFTIDMGVPAVYSRLVYYTRLRNPNGYFAWVWYDFEVWGTNTKPKDISEIGDGSKIDNLKYWTSWEAIEATDAWKNDWIKLADCVIEFPSGWPNDVVGVTNAEDIEFVQNGFHFDVNPDKTNVPCRYIRFVIKKQNNGANYIQAIELQFWGAYIK
jgi:hypothetical protein